MATRRPFWKWCHWKAIGFCLWPPSTRIWSLKLKFQSKLDLHSGNHATYRVQKRKIQYGRQAAILKMTLLKINRLLHIYISIVPLKFEVDIQSQSKVRVWKPKNPIWPPGGHFEINSLLPMATINMLMKFEIEIPKQTWLMFRKPCRLQTDGQTDGRTRWIQYTPLQLRWAGV